MEYLSLKEIPSYKFFIFLVTLFLVTLPGWMQQTSAQSDNLLVPWETSPGSQIPKIDALYHTVMGDTNANGERANLNRVYILQKGGFYQNTENFENKDKNGVSYPLRFVGETPDPGNHMGNPPVLLMSSRSDGSFNGKILTGYGDVYMKNIYVIGSDANGIQTYYQPMEFEADNALCIFDSCYFERSNWAITAWNGKNNIIKFTNCKWFNLVERPATQQWAGRGITCWADQDSVIIENCTFIM